MMIWQSTCQQRRVGNLKLPTPARLCAVHAWGIAAHALSRCLTYDNRPANKLDRNL